MDHESKMLAVDKEIQRLEAELQSMHPSTFLATKKSDTDKTTDIAHFDAGVIPLLKEKQWKVTKSVMN